ncbi:MAG: hypothetical protein WC758_08165 [Candidatus Woesearchaeota archaeon]|jgi:hypothetical protein
MEKETKIIQDKRQTRATIPQEFVDELKITKSEIMIWKIKNMNLIGMLKRNREVKK